MYLLEILMKHNKHHEISTIVTDKTLLIQFIVPSDIYNTITI